MRKITLALAALASLAIALPSPAPAQSPPLVVKESKHSVKVTLGRLAKALEARGIPIVAWVDHAKGAKAAGMELPPTEVIMFGNPKLGTPLMKVNPQSGIDLPMRVIAWEDGKGKVWIAYTPPDALKARYGLTGVDEALKGMAGALDGLVTGAAKAD